MGLSGRRFDPCHLDNVFVAQLVLEHLTFNEGVTGSSPVGDTKNLVNLSDLYQKMVIFVKKKLKHGTYTLRLIRG